MPDTSLPPAWRDALGALPIANRRFILGVAGPPGAGKSSAAQALVAAFGDAAVLVPMDGFHLANAELARLGRADRKGAPDTFDPAGYVALLTRIRAGRDIVHAPVFRREIEEPVAGAIAVRPGHRLVVTEGNYLLHWPEVRPLLDACWYVDIDEGTRIDRLVARHVAHGRAPEAARAWVLRSDEANARLVQAGRHRADRILRWPG